MGVSKPMSKMVIHCSSGFENSGDEAILEVMLKRYVGKHEITVLSLNVKNTSARYGHFPVRFLSQAGSAAKKAIDFCDIFILGGGGLLQDTTSVYNVYRWLSKLRYALKRRKKTCLYANSVGELSYSFNRRAVSRTLKKVGLITLRDVESSTLLRQLGINKNVYVTADPVFSWEDPSGKTEILQRLPARYICFAIRHWYDINPLLPVKVAMKLKYRSTKNRLNYARYIATLAETVNRVNNELGISVVFLSMCYPRDMKTAKDVLVGVEDKHRNIIVGQERLPVNEAVEIVRHSAMTVGMRLHSLIYAMATYTPCAAIIYQSKVSGLTQGADIPKLHVDTMTAESLIAAIKTVLFGKGWSEDAYRSFVDDMKFGEQQNILLLDQYMSVPFLEEGIR